MLFLSDHEKGYLFGLSDIAQSNTWEWVYSRTLPTFNDWDVGQPENNNEHCAAFLGHWNFKWHDIYCHDKYHFICQERAH